MVGSFSGAIQCGFLRTMSSEFQNVVTRWHLSCIADLMELVRAVVDDCAFFCRLGFAFNVRLQASVEDNHNFLVDVFVGRVRLDAGAEYRLMHFQGETRMIRSEEDATALFRLTVKISTLIGMINFGIQTDRVLLGPSLPGQQRKEKMKLSARQIHMDL